MRTNNHSCDEVAANAQQLAIDFAAGRRDDGIQRSSDHAGRIWNSHARGYLLEYLCKVNGPFMAEDVRDFAERMGLEPPPDPRAWGGVMQSAAKAGLIRKVGFAPAKSSNLSPKVQWEGA